MEAPKIISLLPSSTEIVYALGFGENLVGRSHECDFPERVKELPVLTAPKFNPEGASYQIHERVEAIIKDALSVYRVNAELLRKLQPDFILTQTQCEVCAVSEKDVVEAVSQWVGSPPRLISLSPNSLSDVWADIGRVGKALQAEKMAETLISTIQERMSTIRQRAESLRNPTVLCVEWLDPLMTAGNWVPEMVESAGGRAILSERDKHSSWITWDAIVRENPDVIILMPCGFSISRTKEELSLLTKKGDWKDLTAVRENRVYLVDGNQYFNRPGPRLLESTEILCEILHPEVWHFGYENRGWFSCR